MITLPYEIHYIKRKDIDIARYDACIEQAKNSLIYAYSWYLDTVCETWDVLEWGDYTAVLPVPFLRLKRHFYRKNIYQPDTIQQLGLFTKKVLDHSLASLFIERFLSLKPRSYHFNYFDSKQFFATHPSLTERINYELDLSKTYNEIRAAYGSNLKRNLKKALRSAFEIRTIGVTDFLDFKKNHTHYRVNNRQWQKIDRLSRKAGEVKAMICYGLYKEDTLQAALALLKDSHRFILLNSATGDFAKKHGGIAWLLDTLIRENAGTNLILDFEGSMLPGVARFYKGFGAKEVNYLTFYNLSLTKKFIRTVNES